MMAYRHVHTPLRLVHHLLQLAQMLFQVVELLERFAGRAAEFVTQLVRGPATHNAEAVNHIAGLGELPDERGARKGLTRALG
jgi:hypothetical protein